MNWQITTVKQAKNSVKMDSGLISYLRTYERDIYVACLSTDYVDMEKGEGSIIREFDQLLWEEIGVKITRQIEDDYRKFTNGTFEDEMLTNFHKNTCGFNK